MRKTRSKSSFSLFSIGLLIATIGVGLGTWRHWTRDERAHEMLFSCGGRVSVDYDWQRFPENAKLVHTAGDERLDWRPRRPGEYLRVHLGSEWQRRQFPAPWIRDLVGVKALDLDNSPYVSKDWFIQMGSLRQLRFLSIRNLEPEDAWFRHLASLESLESVHLGNSSIGDLALKHLQALPKLEHMNLAMTDITDDGCRALNPQLRRLSLFGTRITDRSISSLLNLKHLTYINVTGTQITDRGIVRLSKLPSLETISAYGIVDDSTVARCKALRPNLNPLEIHWKSDEEEELQNVDVDPFGEPATGRDPFAEQAKDECPLPQREPMPR